MTQSSPLYLLLEQRLGRPLTDVITERRGTQSWPEIARAIAAETGIEVNPETLRNWFRDRITVEVTVT